MRISVKFKLLFILILIPIITLIAYRFMVGQMIKSDKITYVFDNLATKNTENFTHLKATFSELKTYDHILIDSLTDENNLRSITNSVLISNPKINEINISSFGGRNIYEIESANKTKKKLITKELLKKNLGAWKSGYVFKKLTYNSFLVMNKYKKDNKDFLISKIISLEDFSEHLDKDNVYTIYLITKEKNEILFSQNELGNKNSEKDLFNSFSKKKDLLGGVKTLNLDHEDYLIAFDETSEGVIVLTLLQKRTVLGIIKDLDTKSILFLIVAISFAGILSLFASSKFTKTMNELHSVAYKITNGEYSIKVTKKSRDEIGDLASAFEIMETKVAKLLSKLKNYNKKLESLVEKRTQELQKSLDLQSTMINSLSEGFMIVDRNGIISKIHSKASEDIFEKNPSLCRFGDLLNIDSEEHNEITALFAAMIDQKAPFDELKQFLPTQIQLDSGKIVHIEYSPMFNQKGKCTNIVISALDKTTEVASIKQSENQKAYAEMVITILKDRSGYFDFVKNVKNLDSEYNKTHDIKSLYRKVHTLKGNAGYYKINSLVSSLHDLEHFIEENPSATNEIIIQEIDKSKQILKDITLKQLTWLGTNAYYGTNENSIQVSTEVIRKYALMLRAEDVSHNLYQVFLDHIYSTPLMNVFQKYNDLLIHLAKVENIKIKNIEWIGFDQKILPNQYNDIFDNLVHVYRNIMAHAFKGREKKLNAIRNTAQIQSKNGVQYLRIAIADNGIGINTKELKSCLIEKGLYNKEMDNTTMLNMIFEDGVSTSRNVGHIAGRGMGLSSLKEALKKHRGTISINAVPGKGTMFIITFPLNNEFTQSGDNTWKKAA